jgi:GntR family transcriptional regulator
MLTIDAKDAVPIWKQIEQGMRHLVASRALRPGSVVPSVRDLARDLRVNPMTVSKAYQRLTEQGVLEVRRGEGTFVAAGPPTVPAAERSRTLRAAATRLVSVAATLGASREEVLDAVGGAWDGTVVKRGGGR